MKPTGGNALLDKQKWNTDDYFFFLAAASIQSQLVYTNTKVTFVQTAKYRVRVNYRRILQNHIFTNTEQKYMTLLPFERGMFAVS